MPGCGPEAEPSGGSKAINRAVLTYLIENQFGEEKPEILVVRPVSRAQQRDEKRWASTWAYIRGDPYRGDSLRDLRDDTCRSFVESNQESHDLTESLDAPLPVVLLRSEEFSAWEKERVVVHETGDSGAWGRFHVRYPRAHAYIGLSRPGMSDDGTQALVGVGMGRGSLNGWSGYCLLEQVSGRWKVMGLCVTEVS